jgi:hypothetical protein
MTQEHPSGRWSKRSVAIIRVSPCHRAPESPVATADKQQRETTMTGGTGMADCGIAAVSFTSSTAT